MSEDDRIKDAGTTFVALADAQKEQHRLMRHAKCHAARLREAAEVLDSLIEWAKLAEKTGETSDRVPNLGVYPGVGQLREFVEATKKQTKTACSRRSHLLAKYEHVTL